MYTLGELKLAIYFWTHQKMKTKKTGKHKIEKNVDQLLENLNMNALNTILANITMKHVKITPNPQFLELI
jgi:hypothetical protein